MKLKKARLAAGKTQHDIVKAMKSVSPSANKYLYSKMENGHCAPTVPQLQAFLFVTQASLEAVATTAELRFWQGKGASPKKDNRRAKCRISARIPPEMEYLAEKLPEMVRRCGYGNITAWMQHCMKRLEYEDAQRRRKHVG